MRTVAECNHILANRGPADYLIAPSFQQDAILQLVSSSCETCFIFALISLCAARIKFAIFIEVDLTANRMGEISQSPSHPKPYCAALTVPVATGRLAHL